MARISRSVPSTGLRCGSEPLLRLPHVLGCVLAAFVCGHDDRVRRCPRRSSCPEPPLISVTGSKRKEAAGSGDRGTAATAWV